MLTFIRSELALLGAVATAAIIYAAGDRWLPSLANPILFAVVFAWVFGVMVWACFGAVRHADSLAELLGEPYGTLILTFAATCIEISVMGAIMLNGDLYPGLPRDTMMAVVMIVLNGMVGTCLLIGGIRFREQEFNLQGTRAFLGVLVTLAALALILPRFMGRTSAFEIKLARAIPFSTLSVVLYGAFIVIQTIRHRGYFTEPSADGAPPPVPEHGKHPHGLSTRGTPYHAILLILVLVPIVLLAEKLAILVDEGTRALNAPSAAGGILIAILVLSPEGLAAIRAARVNHLQRALNISLGSALSTISLTVPAVVTLSLVTGTPIMLGLSDAGIVLLTLTLLVSVITFSGRTNVLQGVVHLVVFAMYAIMTLVP